MRRLSYRLKYGKFFKGGILGYIQRVMIFVVSILVFTFVISLFSSREFKAVLQFSILLVAIIGALSVLGSSSTTSNVAYTLIKANTRMTSAVKQDIELRHGSYSFCIFMGISSGILYIIYSLR